MSLSDSKPPDTTLPAETHIKVEDNHRNWQNTKTEVSALKISSSPVTIGHNGDIPHISLGEELVGPIELVEENKELGKKFGAIKVSLASLPSTIVEDVILKTCKLISLEQDEILERTKFYKRLVEVQIPSIKEESVSNGASIDVNNGGVISGTNVNGNGATVNGSDATVSNGATVNGSDATVNGYDVTSGNNVTATRNTTVTPTVSSASSTLESIPMVNNKPIDLFRLYHEIERVGLEYVDWKKLDKKFNIDVEPIYQQYLSRLHDGTPSTINLINGNHNSVNETPNEVNSTPDEVNSTPNEVNGTPRVNGASEITANETKRIHEYPLIMNSNKRFKRSIRSKTSKGFLFNTGTFDISINSSSVDTQLNYSLRNIIFNQLITDTEDGTPSRLSEIADDDQAFQRNLFKTFGVPSNVDLTEMEAWYWQYIDKYHEFQVGKDISKHSLGCGFSRLADSLDHMKSSNYNRELNDPTRIKQYTSDSLHPWNLNNVPTIPNSLLGALSEADLNNNDILSSSINVSTTFSTENWKCEDHFSQVINYNILGAYKKWYIIPESEFEKFETLIRSINDQRSNLNNVSKDDVSSCQTRLTHSNTLFQGLIDAQGVKNQYNQEFVITPEILKKNDIKFHTTIQKPGEYIIKYPKTYSLSVSYGFGISEEATFLSSLWLDYGIEAEKWLAKQSILPNFSIFKMIINLIQLLDSGAISKFTFDSNIYKKANEVYEKLVDNELELRTIIRDKYPQIRDSIIDEKAFGEVDFSSDDNFQVIFPTRIVLTDKSTKQSFKMSIDSFLKLVDNFKLLEADVKIEMFSHYSDDKMSQFLRLLNEYSVDFNVWLKDYEELMAEENSHSLKVYKSLLTEGSKIYSILNSSHYTRIYYRLIGIKSIGNDEQLMTKFKGYLDNLERFIEDCNGFIEECQSILALKHQQRVRGSNTSSATNNNDGFFVDSNSNQEETLADSSVILPKLAQLLNRVPKLNFVCVETDQLVEFRYEIENFERACRLLNSKENPTITEFNDLINLGKSFGINLKSLNFIIRIRDRMQWFKNFEILSSGKEPINKDNKKEIFGLKNLKNFYHQGINILGSRDVEKIRVIESMILNSNIVLEKIDGFLNTTELNELMIKQVDELIDHIETKFNSKNNDRIFIDINKFEDLLDFRSSLEVLEKFFDFKSSKKRSTELKFTYEDLLKLKADLSNTKLPLNENDVKYLDNKIEAVKKSVNTIYNKLKRIRLNPHISDLSMNDMDINPKQVTSPDLMLMLQKLLYNCNYNFSIDDKYTNSTGYAFLTDTEVTDPNQIYCICRVYEHGTMIECDGCKEWYHESCVKKNAETSNGNGIKIEPSKGVTPKGTTPKTTTKGKAGTKNTATTVKNGPEETKPVAESASKDTDSTNKENESTNRENESTNKEPKKEDSKVIKIEEIEKVIDDDDDGNFTCPICELVNSCNNTDRFLAPQLTHLDLIKIIVDIQKLKVLPKLELNKLNELNIRVCQFAAYASKQVFKIKSVSTDPSEKVDKLRFILRKLYGAGILVEDLFYEVLTTIRTLDKEKYLNDRQQIIMDPALTDLSVVEDKQVKDEDVTENETSIDQQVNDTDKQIEDISTVGDEFINLSNGSVNEGNSVQTIGKDPMEVDSVLEEVEASEMDPSFKSMEGDVPENVQPHIPEPVSEVVEPISGPIAESVPVGVSEPSFDTIPEPSKKEIVESTPVPSTQPVVANLLTTPPTTQPRESPEVVSELKDSLDNITKEPIPVIIPNPETISSTPKAEPVVDITVSNPESIAETPVQKTELIIPNPKTIAETVAPNQETVAPKQTAANPEPTAETSAPKIESAVLISETNAETLATKTETLATKTEILATKTEILATKTEPTALNSETTAETCTPKTEPIIPNVETNVTPTVGTPQHQSYLQNNGSNDNNE